MPSSAPGLLGVLLEHRRLLVELVRRDIRTRFAGARFGLLWSLINPAVQLAAYTLIFGYVYNRGSGAGGAKASSLFCGLWPWWAFQEGLMRGTGALVEQASLLRRVPMPAVLPVFAATIGAILIQMLGFGLFLVVFASMGAVDPSAAWGWLPLLVVLQLAITASGALTLAPLYLVARDVMYAVNLALTVGFFFSPVLYALDYLPAPLRSVAMLNPLAGLLGLYRTCVMGDAWPPVVSLVMLGATIAAAWRVGARLMARVAGRIDEYC